MIQRGICIFNTLACREEPLHKSQMTTQLLFGETYQVLEIKDNWLYVACEHDGYQAWIPSNQHTAFENSDLNFFRISQPVQWIEHSYKSSTHLIPLFAGSRFPELSTNKWEIDSHQFLFNNIEKKIFEFSYEHVKVLSAIFLHTPYLWGGRSPAGMDCSGFVQLVYAMMGVSLPRDAWQQSALGKTIHFIDETQPGDLAFFDNDEGKIIHVGILLNHHTIIHASGCVHIDFLDNEGIFNTDLKKHTHQLRIIKRMC